MRTPESWLPAMASTFTPIPTAALTKSSKAVTADAHDLYVLGCPAREERRCGGDWRASPFVL